MMPALARLALVAENDSSTQRLLSVLLSRQAMTVDTTASGAEASLLARHVAYDVLVLDLLLPEVTGFDILEQLAASQPDALGRTIVLSSVAEVQLQSVRERYPQLTVLRKPFELEDFLIAIHRVTDAQTANHVSPMRDFVRRSIRFGAKAALVTQHEGGSLRIRHSFGYPEKWLREFASIDLGLQVPLTLAAKRSRPIWLASVRRAAPDYPLLVPIWEAERTHSVAALPIRGGDTVLGVAGWSFGEPRSFDENEQRELAALADEAAVLIEDAGHAVSA